MMRRCSTRFTSPPHPVRPMRFTDIRAGALRRYAGLDAIGISFDETTRREDVAALLAVFNHGESIDFDPFEDIEDVADELRFHFAVAAASGAGCIQRAPPGDGTAAVHDMAEGRDLSLAQSMIPLGSCTMKLNGTTEMLGVTWPASRSSIRLCARAGRRLCDADA